MLILLLKWYLVFVEIPHKEIRIIYLKFHAEYSHFLTYYPYCHTICKLQYKRFASICTKILIIVAENKQSRTSYIILIASFTLTIMRINMWETFRPFCLRILHKPILRYRQICSTTSNPLNIRTDFLFN